MSENLLNLFQSYFLNIIEILGNGMSYVMISIWFDPCLFTETFQRFAPFIIRFLVIFALWIHMAENVWAGKGHNLGERNPLTGPSSCQ